MLAQLEEIVNCQMYGKISGEGCSRGSFLGSYPKGRGFESRPLNHIQLGETMKKLNKINRLKVANSQGQCHDSGLSFGRFDHVALTCGPSIKIKCCHIGRLPAREFQDKD